MQLWALQVWKDYFSHSHGIGPIHLASTIEERTTGSSPNSAIVKLAHLREAHTCAFLINPNADVRGVFGRFCSDSMVGCVHALLEGLRRASLVGLDWIAPFLESGRLCPAHVSLAGNTAYESCRIQGSSNLRAIHPFHVSIPLSSHQYRSSHLLSRPYVSNFKFQRGQG
jgi:hypothetical protein